MSAFTYTILIPSSLRLKAKTSMLALFPSTPGRDRADSLSQNSLMPHKVKRIRDKRERGNEPEGMSVPRNDFIRNTQNPKNSSGNQEPTLIALGIQ